MAANFVDASCDSFGDIVLTSEQKLTAIAATCFVLRFLVEADNRENARRQMLGFSDAAIFHRWMSLGWALREADVVSLLSPTQRIQLEEFLTVYQSISWCPIETHPFVSDAPIEELNRLTPFATVLLRSLETLV